MARGSLRAALITSTRAIPNAAVDQLSDYDVILVVRDIHPYVTDRSWLEDFGEVLVVYWDPIQPDPIYGVERCANVTQYASGLKIDFTLWPTTLFEKIVAAPVLPPELDAGYQLLLDKDRLAEGMLPSTGRAFIPARPALADFQIWINDFLTDAPYVAKCLWRGDLLPAKWCLDYDMKHIYLLKMLEWRVEIDHNWSIPVRNLGKGLKKQLPPETWSALEQTFAGSDIGGNWQALDNTLALFRQVAIEVGASLGYEYPHELHQRVSDYVKQIKDLPK
jgi:aminoglycoside 6-adenylyltransferase